jgi:threonine dehydratase
VRAELDRSTLPGPTLAEFEAARERVAAVVQKTPMEVSRFLSESAGVPVFLKAENLQRTGSYKIRGAYNRLSQLTPDERARGVVAASAGNHAQGVALAARELGIAATIYMPTGVALPKLQATSGYGASVVLEGDIFDDTYAAAQAFAESTGATFIPPFDHHDIVAGQGTLGLEILEELPEVGTLIIPIGGGGLISGVASAIAHAAPERNIRIIGVQAHNAAPYVPSLAAGEIIPVTLGPTIADGIAVARPGTLNFEIIRHTVDEVVTVSDDDIARALVVLLERAKLVVEPAGAAGVAALLSGVVDVEGPTVVVLSGGNIDPMVMERVIGRGLAADQRYLKVVIPLPDRPGQLARIAEIISEANANVVEVLHTRHGSGLMISEVGIEIHMETRGPTHAELVLRHLRDAGYRPRVTT